MYWGLFTNQLGGSGGLFLVLMFYLFIIGLPVWFLFQFSSKAKRAIPTQDPVLLENALRFLKYFFTFYGDIAAFFIGLYVLILLVAVMQ